MSYRSFAFFLVIATSAARATPLPRLESRNMPRTCQFVFEVESDLRITLPSNSDEGWKIFYSYVDAYDESRRGLEPGDLELKSFVRGSQAIWSLMSFRAPTRFLRRVVEFWLERETPASRARRRAERLPADPSLVYRAEFARQFGEQCHPGGRDQTPWLQREVTLVKSAN